MANTYESYKDSGTTWLGMVPSGWNVQKSKTVFEQSKTKGNEIPVLLAASQKYGMIPQSKIEGVVQVGENADMQTFKTVHKNDYVISLRSFQGGFEMSDYEGVCSPAYTVFRARNEINNKYYKYLFKVKPFIDKINSFYQGIREGKQIHFEEFAMMDIPVPTILEQTNIAEFLDAKCLEIDSLISIQEEMITELIDYKKSIISESVIRGIKNNTKLKESGIEWIGNIPENWALFRIKNLIKSSSKGNGITKDEVFEDGDTPCVRYGEIYSKYNNSFDSCLSYTKNDVLASPRFFHKGDILCAGTGELVEEIGKSIVYKGALECLAGGDIIILTPTEMMDPVFMNYALNSHQAQSQKSCSKAKLKVVHISASDIENIIIPVPSLIEQQEIANYLDKKSFQIDSLIEIKRNKILELRDYKKSIIFEYVTGKKRV